jgi:hypothetical protein
LPKLIDRRPHEAPEIVAVVSTPAPEHGPQNLSAAAAEQLGLALRPAAEHRHSSFAPCCVNATSTSS